MPLPPLCIWACCRRWLTRDDNGRHTVFAARAGARHVYAIEASAFASKARDNIRANGLEERIRCGGARCGGVVAAELTRVAADGHSVIQGKVEDVQLPAGVDKVDIIISEWMVCIVSG